MQTYGLEFKFMMVKS